MKLVSNRSARQVLNRQGSALVHQQDVLRQLVHDELKTRGRVDALEAFRDLGWLGRLRWLIRGMHG